MNGDTLVRTRAWLDGVGLGGDYTDATLGAIAGALEEGLTAEGVAEAVRIAKDAREGER